MYYNIFISLLTSLTTFIAVILAYLYVVKGKFRDNNDAKPETKANERSVNDKRKTTTTEHLDTEGGMYIIYIKS